MNLLTDLLLTSVNKGSNNIFLTDIRSHKSFSYQNLLNSSKYVQNYLAEKKIHPGDNIVFLTTNNYFFYPLLFAWAAQRASLVPVNPRNHLSDIHSIIKDCSGKIIFYDEFEENKIIPLKSSENWIPVKHDNWELLTPKEFTRYGSALNSIDGSADDPALIIYTSGTSGHSKGVVLTHKNLCQACAFTSLYNYKAGQKFLSLLPFYHIYAPLFTGIACIMYNSHVVINSNSSYFTIVKFIWKIVEHYKINVLSLTPSIMAMLLKLFPKGANANISSLNYALVGTAPLYEPLWKSFEKVFKINCYQGYGLTETSGWATMTPPDKRKKYTTAGIPINCEIKINCPKKPYCSSQNKRFSHSWKYS